MEMIGKQLSHYRITEKIGAGGMGVVYKAHDDQLDREVAVKVLRRGSFGDEKARKRFRQEALSLARLNHPNIATVHYFGTQDGIDFLVTELISGMNLDVKLARGPLPIAEVVRLGVQLAEGLSAAHQQGIVHRDLKPGNLRVTNDGRLKILDFGLAQFMPHMSDLGLTATLSTSESVSGTLPYMAPEQLSGETADSCTDIWSAGAVLYEMAAGKRPFPERTPALLINAILSQNPQPASKVNPEVSAELDGVILKALARDRTRRYSSADLLASDLGRSGGLPSTGTTIPVKRQTSKTGLAVAALLFVAAGSSLFFYLHRNHVASPPTVVNRRRSVAVLGFKNLSQNPEKAWLSTALSEMLTTELSEGNQLRTIPGESVARMKASLALPEAEGFSQQTLTKIRQNIGSDEVVMGSYLPLGGGQLRLDVRLQDALHGDTLISVSEKGSESDIDSLISRTGAELRSEMGIATLSAEQFALVRASLPANAEAARIYSQGLGKLRLSDPLAARDLLEKAAVLDPEHAPTRSVLAQALSDLGYGEQAKEEAKQALSLSRRFSQEERLLIEGRAHEIRSEIPQAIEAYRTLWSSFPDNLDYGLLLIRAQVAGGHGKEAEIVLADLRNLNVSEADAARIDLADASIGASLSDFRRQQSKSEQAVKKGAEVGASLLAAQALQIEADAWERMGQSQKTIELSNQARDLYVSSGNRRGAARSLLVVGDVLFDQGDYEGAKKQFENALPVFEELGTQASIRSARERIGNVFYAEGKLQESKKYYEQVLRIDHEVNDPFGLASDYGNLANALDGLGDLKGALKMQQQSLSAFNQIGDRRGSSATLNNIGNLFIELGNLDESKNYFQQSLNLAREIAYRRGEPYPISGLGDTLLAQGDIPAARRQYEEALALCKEMNDEDFAAQITLSLATIAFLEEKYTEGESQASQSAAAYEKSNSVGNSAWAHAVLARNLLGTGNLAGARVAAEKARALAAKTTAVAPRFEAALADAFIKTKSGNSGEARQELSIALEAAHKLGYRLYEYQLRLAVCEAELASNHTAAMTHLTKLEKQARANGALLVANRAQKLQAAKNISRN